MINLMTLLKDFASKVRDKSATVWDYVELIGAICQALNELRLRPVGASSDAEDDRRLAGLADDIAIELTGDTLELSHEGALATAALLSLLRLLLRHI